MSTSSEDIPSHFVAPGSAVSDVPIFLTGFARSGTTWINQLMQEYFDAGFVNEGQFIISFGNGLPRYGNLREVGSRERLIHDLANDEYFSILKRNYCIEIDWGRIRQSYESFAGIVKGVLIQIAERLGKHRIGSKYPVFGRHLTLLNNLFPDCRVIHLVRDGRDCALSHKMVRWGHQNTYSAAISWRRYLEAARHSSKQLRSRYLEIRYEDLLMEPGATMRELERFITGRDEYSITTRFLEGHSVLKTDKVARWRHAMPTGSQAIFEAVAGDMLKLYDYPVTGIDHATPFLFKAGYLAQDQLMREYWRLARKVFKGIPEHK
ncbi:MAG: sulfotransferase family protein [Rhodanobacteraceae bacterium]